jgi:hypothetical protein
MSSDMPDWLAGLVSAPEDEDDDQLLAVPTRPQASVAQPQVAMPQPQAVAAQPQAVVFEDADMMADLRSQVVADEPTPTPAVSRRRSRYVFGLLPWQIFFLAVLMFLDVAVIGMLFLVMLGRVVLPF